MRRPFILAATVALSLAVTGAPVLGVPGGPIGTLPTGTYRCEKPGDISGRTAVRVPDDDFRVLASSSYSTAGKRGSYLLTGGDVVMTGGPFEGRKFLRTSVGYLRVIGTDGQPGEQRCVLSTRVMP